MFGIGGAELLVIFLFALLFIGPKKLPELAKGLGKGIREFQKAKDDLFDQVSASADQTTKPENKNSDDAPIEVVAESKETKNSSDNSNA